MDVYGLSFVFLVFVLLLNESLQGARPTWKILKKGSQDGRIFVLIGGFGQPAESWQTFCQALRPEDRAMVLTRRHRENRSWTVVPVSWAPLWVQKWVMARHIRRIPGLGDHKITLVAHSVGALLADYVAHRLPNQVEAVCLLNPYPLGQRGALLSRWTFWRQGGLHSLPMSLLATIMFWRGFRPTMGVTSRLFANDQLSLLKLRVYHMSLVPDSVLQFLAMVLWATGTGLLRIRQKNWNGHISVIYAEADPIFRADDIRVTGFRLGARTRRFHLATPHCWWLNDATEVLTYNLHVLRLSLYPELQHSDELPSESEPGEHGAAHLH